MKSLPVEFAASFNTSVLLLQRLNSRELPRSGLNRIYQAATDPAETGLNQIKEIARTCFHRGKDPYEMFQKSSWSFFE